LKGFLRTKGNKIIDGNNRPIVLKGVNLGGWLMMEAYILHAPNFAVQLFKKEFEKKLGPRSLRSFEKEFRNNFVKESDIKHISKLGFNCIRLPFNYRLVESSPYKFNKNGLAYLDIVIKWAKKYGIWIILDLHAAPGSQNHDWHSDSLGDAELWTKRSNQKRTLAIWKFLAKRYKDEECIAGYDLINESVLSNTKLLNKFYKEIIRAIRSVDKNHILFIEGSKWAMDIDCLDNFNDDNYVLSIHHYLPLEYTFNFIPHLSYPLKSKKEIWGKSEARKYLRKYKKISDKRKVPIFVGEFGINSRRGLYGEDKWLKDTLDCFKEFNFHWTYWTYKAIKNSCFPDGIYSFYDNTPWVNRHGPLYGWDTYKLHWSSNKNKMINSWRTEKFRANNKILKVLKDAAK